jgi:hypothetical protein
MRLGKKEPSLTHPALKPPASFASSKSLRLRSKNDLILLKTFTAKTQRKIRDRSLFFASS